MNLFSDWDKSMREAAEKVTEEILRDLYKRQESLFLGSTTDAPRFSNPGDLGSLVNLMSAFDKPSAPPGPSLMGMRIIVSPWVCDEIEEMGSKQWRRRKFSPPYRKPVIRCNVRRVPSESIWMVGGNAMVHPMMEARLRAAIKGIGK